MKHPIASLLLVVAALLPASLATPAQAATMILHNFTGGTSDGSSPQGSLTLSGSKLYGMTYQGGSGDYGTLFGMNADGTGYTTLHIFNSQGGANPFGSLTLSGTKLYGMTAQGGINLGGTIFSMNTDGTGFNLLHSFTGGANDGSLPRGSLLLSGSKFYGMTYNGGINFNGGGTIFSMNTDGTGFTLLHRFLGGASDGLHPNGSLALSGSKLYGMTQSGGSNDTGALFSISTDGSGFGLLHSFTDGPNDGAGPNGSLTLSGSTIYGSTNAGGGEIPGIGAGTIFRLNTDGTGFSLLHTFVSGIDDGARPTALTLAGTTLYGMSTFGGNNLGTLFSIGTNGGGFRLLESFSGAPADGANPSSFGALTLSGDASTLYGLTAFGGTANKGVVFSKAVPEPGTFVLFGLGALLLSARRRNARV